MMRRVSCRFGAGLVLAVFGGPGAAVAATGITPSTHPGCDYELVGEITSDITAGLEDFWGWPEAVLCLDSPGGSLPGGMALFQIVAERSIMTRIPAGWRCESICAPVFMAGSWTTGLGVPTNNSANQLDPGGILGFHAPALNLPDQGSYPPEVVASAFNAAIQAASTLYRASLREEDEWRSFNEYLFARMLATPHDQMYYIETVADAVLADIRLGVVALPETIEKAHIANLCDSTYLRQARLMQRVPEGDALSAYAPLRHDAWPYSSESWEAELRHVSIEARDDGSFVGYVSGYEMQLRGYVGVACKVEFWQYDQPRTPENTPPDTFISFEDRGWTVTFYEYAGWDKEDEPSETWHIPMNREAIRSTAIAPLWMLHAPETRLDSLVPVFP